MFTAMMEGRRKVAEEQAAALVAMLPPPMIKDLAFLLEAFLAMPHEVRMRFGRWDEILAQPVPGPDLPTARAYAHFARGVALGALGRVEEAAAERAAFAEAAAKVPKENLWGANPTTVVLAVARALPRRGDRVPARGPRRGGGEAPRGGAPRGRPQVRRAAARVRARAPCARGGAPDGRQAGEAEAVYREDLAAQPGERLVAPGPRAGAADAGEGRRARGRGALPRRLEAGGHRGEVLVPVHSGRPVSG